MKRFALAVLALLFTVLPGAAALAQGAGPAIKLIVPYPPGGTADVLARLIAPPLSQSLGQPVVVDNRAGAAGTMATAQVSRAEPDGLTLLFTNVSPSAIAPALSKSASEDPSKDVTAIGLVARSPLVLVAHPSLGVKDLAGLLAAARAAPGRIEYSSAGVGSFGHLSTELLAQAAGVKMLHVPYKGQAPALNAVLSGEVKMSLTSPSAAMFEHTRAGKLTLLGMSYLEASALAPEAVPIARTIPGFDLQFWFGIVGPPKMSEASVERLSSALRGVLADKALAQKFEASGSDVATSSAAQFQQLLASEVLRWRKVVQGANLQATD